MYYACLIKLHHVFRIQRRLGAKLSCSLIDCSFFMYGIDIREYGVRFNSDVYLCCWLDWIVRL